MNADQPTQPPDPEDTGSASRDDESTPTNGASPSPSPARGPATADGRGLQDPPPDYPTTGSETLVTVRFGKMQTRGRFRSRTPGLIYGDRIVVHSERGVELGEVVFKAKRGEETRSMPVGWVLRRATDEDCESHDALNERLDGPGPEFKFCCERIEALELAMRLVDVERPFGGGKIIFYFTADGRVDFRMLVRDLAKRFRTRIEMKQIGVRDEAKVLGDIADCGRELCCRTFLTKLQPISMRMAKVQKTTLDPAKISGRCGRLKCCLRYEYDAYLSLRENLPRAGARVQHDRGLGVVAAMDILSQTVTVVFDGGDRDNVPVDTLRPAPKGAPAAPKRERRPPPAAAESKTAKTEAGAETEPKDAADAIPDPKAEPKLDPKPDRERRKKTGARDEAARRDPKPAEATSDGAEATTPAADEAPKADAATPGDGATPRRERRGGERKRGEGRAAKGDRPPRRDGGGSRRSSRRPRPDGAKSGGKERGPAGDGPSEGRSSEGRPKRRRRPRPKKRPDEGGDTK